MYERFTDRARKVMKLAEQEARCLNHGYIGTEHILVGLVREGTGVGAAVLKNMGVALGRIRKEIDAIVRPGSPETVTGPLPLIPSAKNAMAYAIEEARGLDHNYVGTEHLLLGLLRENEAIAAMTLINFGLRLTDVRQQVQDLVGGGISRNEVADVKPPVSPLVETLATLNAMAGSIEHELERLENQKYAAIKDARYEEAAELRDKQAAADVLWQELLADAQELTEKVSGVLEQLKRM